MFVLVNIYYSRNQNISTELFLFYFKKNSLFRLKELRKIASIVVRWKNLLWLNKDLHFFLSVKLLIGCFSSFLYNNKRRYQSNHIYYIMKLSSITKKIYLSNTYFDNFVIIFSRKNDKLNIVNDLENRISLTGNTTKSLLINFFSY